jgi:hypothetical protein
MLFLTECCHAKASLKNGLFIFYILLKLIKRRSTNYRAFKRDNNIKNGKLWGGNVFLLIIKRLKLTVGKTIKSKHSIGNCKQIKRAASPAISTV